MKLKLDQQVVRPEIEIKIGSAAVVGPEIELKLKLDQQVVRPEIDIGSANSTVWAWIRVKDTFSC